MGDTAELKLNIVSYADNSGFKSAADMGREMSNTLGDGLDKLTDGTNKFTKANDGSKESATGSENAIEKLGLSHHELHKILHLIGTVSGPGVAAGLSGIAAAGGGGLGIVLLAGQQVVELFKQMREEADKFKEKAREAFVETGKQAEEAQKTIDAAKISIDNFFDALDRKRAATDSQNNVNADLQRIKDIGEAAKKAGFVDEAGAAQYVQQQTDEYKMKRAGRQDQNTDALTDQLKTLRDQLNAPQTKAGEQDLIAMKADLEKLREDFAKNELFRPTSATAMNTIGILPADTSGTARSGEIHKTSFEQMQSSLEKQIHDREEENRKLEEHIKLLESEIERRTGDSQGLKSDVNKDRAGIAATDFTTGKGIADILKKGGSVAASDAQFLVVLEQAITGKKLTLAHAVSLIQAQSQSDATIISILDTHKDNIAAVNTRLQQLKRQSQTMPQQVR